MKQAIFDSLDKIPEADRADYKLVTEAGSPNFNKYVLDLDPQHPVAVKNTQLLSEKTTRETQHQTNLSQKDAEIARLAGQIATAKVLPDGHVAVPVAEAQILQEVKTLGDIKEIKTKVEEYPVLKAKDEERTLSERYSEIAEEEGFDPVAFAKLAKDEKLLDRIEARKIDDGKGNKKTHHFVKPAEGTTGDAVALKDHVKESAVFKPFLNSLYLSDEQKKKVRIPDNKTGEVPTDKSAADSYIGSTYKRPDKQGANA